MIWLAIKLAAIFIGGISTGIMMGMLLANKSHKKECKYCRSQMKLINENLEQIDKIIRNEPKNDEWKFKDANGF